MKNLQSTDSQIRSFRTKRFWLPIKICGRFIDSDVRDDKRRHKNRKAYLINYINVMETK